MICFQGTEELRKIRYFCEKTLMYYFFIHLRYVEKNRNKELQIYC